MTLEHWVNRLKQQNKCLPVALRLMALACALFVNPTIPTPNRMPRHRIHSQKDETTDDRTTT
jgi:hypothetical protein